MDRLQLVAKLKVIALCKGESDSFFDAFVPILHICNFKKGHRVINEGDSGRDMYFLIQGAVRILKKTLSREEYTAAILKDEYGIFFGEVGLISDDNRTASVVAETDCIMAELRADEFAAFIEKYPEYGMKFLRELAISICQKLKKSNHDTVVLYEALINEIGHNFL